MHPLEFVLAPQLPAPATLEVEVVLPTAPVVEEEVVEVVLPAAAVVAEDESLYDSNFLEMLLR